MRRKKKLIFAGALIFVILSISAVISLQHLNRDTYSLEINSDEIYRISWLPQAFRPGETTDRGKIEEMVDFLNAWRLTEFRPTSWNVIGGATPDMFIYFFGREENFLGYLHVWDGGMLIRNDANLDFSSHQVTGIGSPIRRFERRFG